MEVRLDGRSAIITGASTGLGLAMAKEFAASGADVAILARRPEVLEEAKQTVSATAKGGRVATFVCDVSKADDIHKTLRWCHQGVRQGRYPDQQCRPVNGDAVGEDHR
jgi:3-oxoacyl-[acyl-carrier protein] reductase